MRRVSIVIPAYNEERSLPRLLEAIRNVDLASMGFEKEIVLVDDGSKDRTSEVASSFSEVRVIRQENQGKGAAVQRGIKECTGDYVLVQDADLEYFPDDYPALLQPLPLTGWAVVYGSRTLGQLKERGWGNGLPGRHPAQGVGPWLANIILSLWALILYGQWFTDLLTGYKVYPTELLARFRVKTAGFETDHELTAKIVRQQVPIYEVPIRYAPRSVAEGKKIRFRDGIIACWTLFKYRFVN